MKLYVSGTDFDKSSTQAKWARRNQYPILCCLLIWIFDILNEIKIFPNFCKNLKLFFLLSICYIKNVLKRSLLGTGAKLPHPPPSSGLTIRYNLFSRQVNVNVKAFNYFVVNIYWGNGIRMERIYLY